MGAQACCAEKPPCCAEDSAAWLYVCAASHAVVPRLPARCAEPAVCEEDSDSTDEASEAEIALEWALAPSQPASARGNRGPRSIFEAAPDIEVTNVGARTATVRWRSLPQGGSAWMCCIRVFRSTCSQPGHTFDPSEAVEIAAFEVDGSLGVCELPCGTLDRSSGPYRIQLVAKPISRAGRSTVSYHFLSASFFTQPEAPGQVEDLCITDVGRLSRDREVHVEWADPVDDGGSPVEEYEVSVFAPADDDGVATIERRAVKPRLGGRGKAVIKGLPPGTGPVRAEVRAKSALGLLGEAACLQGPAAPIEPVAPLRLQARLLPHSASAGTDVSFVRLEFDLPLAGDKRQIEAYHIFAATADVKVEAPIEAQQESGLLCVVPVGNATGPSDADTGRACACTVAVMPNCRYAFSVAASYGEFVSEPTAPTPWVSVPARRPPPPREQPESLRVQGGCSAELLWTSPSSGGGLPITSFKIGVIGMGLASGHDCRATWDVQREITVPMSEVQIVEADAVPEFQTPRKETSPRKEMLLWDEAVAEETTFKYTVLKLEMTSSYRFVVAACTAAGTSEWSRPSVPTRSQAYLDVVQGECKVPSWIQERKGSSLAGLERLLLADGRFGSQLQHELTEDQWVELEAQEDDAEEASLMGTVMSPIGKGFMNGLRGDRSPCVWTANDDRHQPCGSSSTRSTTNSGGSPSLWTPQSGMRPDLSSSDPPSATSLESEPEGFMVSVDTPPESTGSLGRRPSSWEEPASRCGDAVCNVAVVQEAQQDADGVPAAGKCKSHQGLEASKAEVIIRCTSEDSESFNTAWDPDRVYKL